MVEEWLCHAGLEESLEVTKDRKRVFRCRSSDRNCEDKL